MATDHVLVIGAGLAGVSTCAALRGAGHTGRLTLVGAEPGLPYDRPPLSKAFLASEADDDAILLRPLSWYADQDIELLTGVPVAAIDAETGRTEFADGQRLDADVLVLATGGTARRLSGFEDDHEAVHVLRTRKDARRLRAALRPGVRLLVVGGGLIGAEAAATASKLGCDVTLVDPVAVPLAQAIGPQMAEALHLQHSAHGVRVIHAGIESLKAEADDGPLRATLSTGEIVETDHVLIGIGIRPNTELAEQAGLATDNGVLVNDRLCTASPRVYAVGDVARIAGPDGLIPRIEHWDNAQRSGEAAARAILGLPPSAPKTPWFWTDRYGTHLEMAGHFDQEADQVMRGDLATGSGTVFYLRDGLCVGAVSLNQPLDIRAAQRIIDRGLRLDAAKLADEATSLRSLMK